MIDTIKTVQIEGLDAQSILIRFDEISNLIKAINLNPERCFTKSQTPTYLTRTQVAEQLQVSKQTLIVWNRKGVLKGTRIGTRIRYKQSDIEQLMSKPSKTL